ncbi:MAG: LacI family DNA-binding transcriptional regulator [Lachnospiraceae bacterium]|nr:LacI family DNA-binding transcriptional regulator [Lachnospiraceae bacterium]
MASIKEVAALANVSPATVSRVMNGTAKVDDEKRARVLKAIEQTGFIPNEVARTLFKRSAKVIGLIIPSIENPFFTQFSGAVERTADAHGYKVVLFNTDGNVEKEHNVMKMLSAMNADGIILSTSSEGVDSDIENCTIPVVVTDRLMTKKVADAYVHCDHYVGGRLAAEHLIENGCRHIVCFRGKQDISSARERYLGCRDICSEQGLMLHTVDCDYSFEAGINATEEMLKKYPETDGIVACNDMVAISAYKILHQRGIEVPHQIQIIGYDNIQLTRFMTPEITTIAQPIEELGVKAVELVLQHNKTNVKEYILQPKLIIRETTKRMEGKDEESRDFK